MAPPGVPDWRDAEAYAPVIAGGRPALAWEVLRRDPGYRSGWADADDPANRWGLHFRL